GKYIERQKFSSALRKGLGFCDVVLGWDSDDQLYDNAEVSGWHTGYCDAPVTLDIATVRRLPFEEDTLFMLGNFEVHYAAACPRGLVRRVQQIALEMGYKARAAFEYEFFVFGEPPHSVREKGYRGLRPFPPGMFGYSLIRSGVHAELNYM